MKRITYIIGLLGVVIGVLATDMPREYYVGIENTQDSVLKSKLALILNADTVVRLGWGSGKGATWNAFFYTDRDASDNSVIDMYSANKRYYNIDDTSASVKGCDIEHTLPNSWWGGKSGNSTAYNDIHLLVPADYSANRSKSNIPPGYVMGVPKFDNGVMRNGDPGGGITYPLEIAKVFEPSDEYKGDFARMYFYTVTRYEQTPWIMTSSIEGSHALTNDSYLEFQPWMIEILLAWHRVDPVSDKEILRNNTVFDLQKNRNPYIDYPELVEYIWGSKKGQVVHLSNLTTTQQPFAVALEATNISTTGFTANWTMPSEATDVVVDVYKHELQPTDSAWIINLPASSVKYLNACAEIVLKGKIYSASTLFAQLGTGEQAIADGLGEVCIGIDSLSEGRLYFQACSYKSDASTLVVSFDKQRIDSIVLTSDTTTYCYDIPTNVDTIYLRQGVNRKRVVMRSIGVKQAQYKVQKVPHPSSPFQLNKVSSLDVSVSDFTTNDYYYTVTPNGYRTSNIIVVHYSTSTGVEESPVDQEDRGSEKVFINGHIYIRNMDGYYTLMGQKVRGCE